MIFLTFTVFSGFLGVCKPAYCGYWGSWQEENLWLLLVALVTSYTQYVTHDTIHVTCDTWHMTCDAWRIPHEFYFLLFAVRFCIGATIHTHWDIMCLPYGGFLLISNWPVLQLSLTGHKDKDGDKIFTTCQDKIQPEMWHRNWGLQSGTLLRKIYKANILNINWQRTCFKPLKRKYSLFTENLCALKFALHRCEPELEPEPVNPVDPWVCYPHKP